MNSSSPAIISPNSTAGSDDGASSASVRKSSRHAPHLKHLLLVRRVAECFVERRRIPFAHRFEPEQARGVFGGSGIERERVGLHPEGDRRKKSIDGRECLAAEPWPAEALQPVVPQRADPGDIPIERGGDLVGAVCARRSSSRQRLRNSPKPECISAAALRAQARVAEFEGQTPACRSARYSAIASESHTTVSPSTKHGTLPLGEILPKAAQLDV